jgi:hypothetical protein
LNVEATYLKTTKGDLDIRQQAACPARVSDPDGQRLAKARAEFQAAWEAKNARREHRLNRLRCGIAAFHTAALSIGGLWVACLWGLAAFSMFPAAPRVLGRVFMIGLLIAPLLFILVRGAIKLWEYGANCLEARKIEHL